MSNVQNASRSSAFAAVEGDHWVESLDDGRHVLIRPLREEDRERERQFINRLSRRPATSASSARSRKPARRCSIN